MSLPSENILTAPLSTVEDAVMFFDLLESSRAKGKPLPPINHIFFAKVDDGLEFRPYHIRAVSKENKPANYFIVTKSNIIHVNRMASIYENMGSISQWCHEEKVFEKIRNLNFFKKYLLTKSLSFLRNNYQEKKFRVNRAYLSKRLLAGDPIFSKATQNLNAKAFEFEWRKFSVGSLAPVSSLLITEKKDQNTKQDGVLGTEEFVSLQFLYLSEIKRYFAEILVQILSEIINIHTIIEDKALKIRPLQQESNIVGVVNKEVAALSQKRAEQEMKQILIARENMSDLIRLGHVLQGEAFFRQLCNSFFQLGKVVSGSTHEGRSIWAFKIQCVLEKDCVALQPSEEQLLSVVENTLKDAISMLSTIPSCLSSNDLKKKCPFLFDCQSFAAIFSGDALLFDYQMMIMDNVKEGFDVAQSKLPMYKSFVEANDFLLSWESVHGKWKALLESGEPLIGSIPEAEIRNFSSRAFDLEGKVKKLSGHTFGVITVVCDNLVESLGKKLLSAIVNIRKVVVSLVESQTMTLLETAEMWKERLVEPELILDNYIPWLNEVELGEAAYEDFAVRVGETCGLQQLANELIEEMGDHSTEKDDRDLNALLRDPFLQFLTSAKQYHSSKQSTMRDKVLSERSALIQSLQLIDQRLDANFGTLSANDTIPATKKLLKVQDNLSELRKQAGALDKYAQELEMHPLKWLEFGVTEDNLKKYVELWNVYDESEKLKVVLHTTVVGKINGQELRDTIVSLFQRAFKISKTIPGNASESLVKFLGEEKGKANIYLELCNPALKEYHFEEIFEQAGTSRVPASTRTLDSLAAVGLLEKEEIVSEVVSSAVGVFEVEQTVDKIENFWKTREIDVVPYAGRANAYVIDGADELLEEIEEQQVMIQTCLASKFVSEMKEKVVEWESQLSTLRDVILEWISVQKSWMYLEFIFSSDDIKRQLPDESLLFTSADRFFSNLMKKCFAEKIIAPICLQDDTLGKLKKCSYQLDCIQKKLDEYLETKRVAFPRFYFLSNDELLSILSDSRNPLAVQPHLQKCFDNIKELVFADSKTIEAMKSSEGEVVPFSFPVKILGNVENWLNDVERAMRETLFAALSKCVASYSRERRTQWYFEHPAQCVATTDQIVWTLEVEKVISDYKTDANAYSDYTNFFQQELLQTVSLVKNNLTSLQRQVVSNLIVADVHCRDINSKMSTAKCNSVSDFEWLQQLRYYWTEPEGSKTKDCVIEHGAASLSYGYEYLGNQPRLVVTPLTERAFLTCTAALHMQKGAAPQGPAGTGKTESVKDLGKALARQVVVFNCSDGLNYKMMSQMFAGLAQGGAWACFDEFNRIELEVLSVIAQQMLDITTAIAQKLTSMNFEGHRIKLHPNFGVFITMNPGYAGRTELPDNLKSLFRPICMMIPNYALIAEIMFYSEGYTSAGVLADKMIRLYSLASQQLSKQDHYDFGMRAVKAILVVAGRLKRGSPTEDEEHLLVRAICDANLPKFLTDDTHLFLALLHDFFPKVSLDTDGTQQESETISIVKVLEDESEKAMKYAELQPTNGMKSKVVQLFDTLLTRHGLMLVGHTMTGKTTVRDSLSTTLSNLSKRRADFEAHFDSRSLSFFVPTSSVVCNPKSITMTELYGDVNPLTREWQDGVFSYIVRDMVKTISSSEKYEKRHWVVFDGPVDAIWIENLNTVLDDNKMLCLVNGERIRIPEPITIMFEVQDLRVASPATVSRCGMVYVDKDALDGGWRPLLVSLSTKLESQFHTQWKHTRFIELCDLLFPPLLELVRTAGKEYISSVDGQLARNVFMVLKASLLNLQTEMNEEKKDSSRRNSRRRSSLPVRAQALLLGDQLFDAMFVQSCTWGIGGNLADGFREPFANKFLQLIRDNNLYFPQDAEESGLSVFDYCIDTSIGDWSRWSTLVPPFEYNASASFFDIVVPTEHTVILNFLLQSATTVGHHVLLNGLTGTAKSSTVNNFLLSQLKTENTESEYTSFSYTLSAKTSSRSLQETIENKLAKRRGDKELGPQVGKKLMIAVVDDCNVPQLEVYGAAPPIELLRQLITQGGFYDRKKLFFKEVVQTMLVACCGEPGGGKNLMTPRFTSQLLLFCVPQLSSSSMKTIYETILTNFFSVRNFSEEIVRLAGAVVDSTLEAYKRIAIECLPTPEKTHCTFNLRDVSKVVQGIMQVNPKHCDSAEMLINLWSHEASRVFHDRLIDDVDRGWWWRCCVEIIHKNFSAISDNSLSKFNEETLKEVIYGNWGNQKEKDYQEIVSGPSTQEIIAQYLAEYNLQNTVSMNLVFFSQAVQHLSRICRVINQPRGHALLVGVGGSGRSSLCRLAACMMNMDLQTVQIMRGYNIDSFRDEMRKALLDAGARGKEVVFVLSDPQIIFSEMLEDVNNVLNIGEVPGMMRLEDTEVIMRFCRDGCLQSGRPDTRSSIYQYFVGLCRERLHMVLCMSPMSGMFRERLRTFPALVNCTTIDWFSSWPREALLNVARHILTSRDSKQNDPEGGKLTEDLSSQLSELIAFIHQSVQNASEELYTKHHRRNHTTPTSYLVALSLFRTMQVQRQQKLGDNVRRYRDGLKKLSDVNETIVVLKEEIRQMQPALKSALADAEEQRKKVLNETAEADVLRKDCAVEEAAAQELMNNAEEIRKACEEGLAEALPALEAAERALQTLSAKDIQEIKTFTTPPSNVEKTMNAVLILLKEKEGWASAKSCLAKMDFLNRLTDYPRDDISAGLIKKLTVFINDPDFIPEVIEKTSLPCRSMCMWVHAMYKYYFVAKEIAPKRAQLEEAQKELDKAQALLAEKQSALKEVLDKIKVLEETARETKEKADQLTFQIDTAKARLERADQLTNGLASEKIRWEKNLLLLNQQIDCVAGTAALGAGCVAYLGVFPISFRNDLCASWMSEARRLGITFDEDFSLQTMQPEAEIQRWTLQSLPRDTFSIQNATILEHSSRWCYMIDPQGQANDFIRRSKSGMSPNLLVLKQTDDNFMRSIENAVQIGQPVLIESVGETLDAALDPILLKQVRRAGGRNVVVLGDKEVTYNDNFRLYMTTKLSNPVLTPELQVKVTSINFTVTPEGLEDQLLADIVGAERAELQASSDRCIVSIAAQREEIHALEEKVLRMLNEATGDILDNVSLIEALQSSKSTSEKITKELAVVEETSAKIAETRELYRPLASRGSLIYGVIADLAKVDSMYEYSLHFFKNLVVSVLKETQKSDNANVSTSHFEGSGTDVVGPSTNAFQTTTNENQEGDTHANDNNKDADVSENAGKDVALVLERVQMLMEEVMWTTYRVVCRGLFEQHKILFSFLLAATVMKRSSDINEDEWELFLQGSAGRAPQGDFEAEKCPTYMNKVMWSDFGALCSQPAYTKLKEDFLHNQAEWKRWFVDVSGDDVMKVLPSAASVLSKWHQVLLFKSVRPELVHTSVVNLVLHHLGDRYTRTPNFSLSDAFKDSTKLTPIIFILSPGTDPTSLFTSFAIELGFSERRYMLSLGQDQGTRAQKMIEDGRREGCWVYLQNCHVYASWMPRLQQLVESITPNDTHDDFRLWLTSSPSPSFPSAVLQAGLKLTREPPQGLRGKVRDILSIATVAEAWNMKSPSADGSRSSISGADLNTNTAGNAKSVLPQEVTQTIRWRRLTVTLAIFTGVLMERRQYSPLGWNLQYEWGADDFAAGLRTLTTALSRCETDEPVPWKELTYMLGTIDYGGRVTDMWDTRCLEVLTKCFFSAEAEKKRMSNTQDTNTVGYVPDFPEQCSYEELLQVIDTVIPDTHPAPPQQFGLHSNANISLYRRRSMDLVAALVRINTGGGGSSEDAGADTTASQTATSLLQRVPVLLPIVHVEHTADAGTPLQALLSHEVDLYNNLIREIMRSLRDMLRALKGEVVSTRETEETAMRLRYGLVPSSWQQVGYLSLKPLASYFDDFLKRIEFIGDWCRNGPPTSFWLPGFFFPQVFVTSILQSRSRSLIVPIDDMEYRFRVLSPKESDDARTKPNPNLVGAYVHGLYLEGCGYDPVSGGLVDSRLGELTVALPTIHFEPVLISENKRETFLYDCPLYKVSSRAGALSTTGVSTNYIVTLQLPSLNNISPDHWIERGVAALCALDA